MPKVQVVKRRSLRLGSSTAKPIFTGLQTHTIIKGFTPLYTVHVSRYLLIMYHCISLLGGRTWIATVLRGARGLGCLAWPPVKRQVLCTTWCIWVTKTKRSSKKCWNTSSSWTTWRMAGWRATSPWPWRLWKRTTGRWLGVDGDWDFSGKNRESGLRKAKMTCQDCMGFWAHLSDSVRFSKSSVEWIGSTYDIFRGCRKMCSSGSPNIGPAFGCRCGSFSSKSPPRSKFSLSFLCFSDAISWDMLMLRSILYKETALL